MGKKVKTTDVLKNESELEQGLYDDILVKDIGAEAASYQIVETKNVLGQCDIAFNYLSMTSRDSLIITGVGCCGKTTLVNYIAKRIVTGNCPKQFEDSIILGISRKDFPDEYEMILDYFIRICDLCERMGYDKVIFVLDDVEKFPSELAIRFEDIIDGIKENFDFTLLRFVITADISIVSDEKTSIIVASNSIEIAGENLLKNIVDAIWPQILVYQKVHNVSISKKMAYKIVSYIKDYEFFATIIADFRTYLEHIERAIIYAEKSGDKKVNISHIKKLFTAWDTELIKNNAKEIKITAKHEAGHALVELCNPQQYSVQGVIGMLPDSPIGGMCQNFGSVDLCDRKDVIIEIACSLAGRIMSGSEDCGDSNDLKEANDMARKWVMTCGCGKKLGKYVSLEEEKWMLNASEKVRKAVEDEVSKMLLEGEAYCKKIYKKHKKFHKLLSREIEKKFILTRSEILKLWKDYLKQSKKKKKNKKKKK